MWYTAISQFWSLPELLSQFSWYQISSWYTVNIIWVYYQWGNNATGQISDLFLQFRVTAGCLLASLSARKVTTLMCLKEARRSRKKTQMVFYFFSVLSVFAGVCPNLTCSRSCIPPLHHALLLISAFLFKFYRTPLRSLCNASEICSDLKTGVELLSFWENALYCMYAAGEATIYLCHRKK